MENNNTGWVYREDISEKNNSVSLERVAISDEFLKELLEISTTHNFTLSLKGVTIKEGADVNADQSAYDIKNLYKDGPGDDPLENVISEKYEVRHKENEVIEAQRIANELFEFEQAKKQLEAETFPPQTETAAIRLYKNELERQKQYLEYAYKQRDKYKEDLDEAIRGQSILRAGYFNSPTDAPTGDPIGFIPTGFTIDNSETNDLQNK